jgi:hypothetical protein
MSTPKGDNGMTDPGDDLDDGNDDPRQLAARIRADDPGPDHVDDPDDECPRALARRISRAAGHRAR